MFATISGGIYFQEFNTMEAYQWAGFATGCCVMFCGLYFLAPVTDDDDDDAIQLDVGGDGFSVPPAPQWKDEYVDGGEAVSVRAREVSTRERQASISRERQGSMSFPVIEIHHRLSRAASSFTPENSEKSTGRSSRRLSYVDGIALASGMGGMAFAGRDSFSGRARSISGRDSFSGPPPGARYAWPSCDAPPMPALPQSPSSSQRSSAMANGVPSGGGSPSSFGKGRRMSARELLPTLEPRRSAHHSPHTTVRTPQSADHSPRRALAACVRSTRPPPVCTRRRRLRIVP